jgi:hypothetical protein
MEDDGKGVWIRVERERLPKALRALQHQTFAIIDLVWKSDQRGALKNHQEYAYTNRN